MNDSVLNVWHNGPNRAERRTWRRTRPKHILNTSHVQEQLEKQRSRNKYDAAGTIISWLDYLRNKYNTPTKKVIALSNYL